MPAGAGTSIVISPRHIHNMCALQITNQFWLEKYRKQDFQAFGTEADREARVRDYSRTEVSRPAVPAAHSLAC